MITYSEHIDENTFDDRKINKTSSKFCQPSIFVYFIIANVFQLEKEKITCHCYCSSTNVLMLGARFCFSTSEDLIRSIKLIIITKYKHFLYI